jgi:hypothetical protein
MHNFSRRYSVDFDIVLCCGSRIKGWRIGPRALRFVGKPMEDADIWPASEHF